MEDPKRNYFYKKNDTQPNSELPVSLEDGSMVTVEFDLGGNIVSITDADGNQWENVEIANVQFQAGAELGAAISGEKLNESNTGGRVGYFVDIKDKSKMPATTKLPFYLFKNYAKNQHKALETAIKMGSKYDSPVRELFRRNGKVVKGEVVWSPENINELTRSAVRKIISESIKEVIYEAYVEKRKKIKSVLRPIITEMLQQEAVFQMKHPDAITDPKLKKFRDLLSNFSRLSNSKSSDEVALINFVKADTGKGEQVYSNAFVIGFPIGYFLVFGKNGEYKIAKAKRNNQKSAQSPFNYLYGKPVSLKLPTDETSAIKFVEAMGNISVSPEILSK